MAIDAGALAEDLVGWGKANYVALKLMDDINTAWSAFSHFAKVVDTIRHIFVAMYATGGANVRPIVEEICTRFAAVTSTSLLLKDNDVLLILVREVWYRYGQSTVR
jgi:hypothetical protein